MGRVVARSTEALTAARKFLGTLPTGGLCRAARTKVIEEWKTVRGRKVRGVPWVSEERFLKGLSRVGAKRLRVKQNGKLHSVWCVGCTHATPEWGGKAKKNGEDEDDEDEDAEDEDAEDEDDEEDEEGEDEGRKISFKAYQRLLRRYNRLKNKKIPRLYQADGSYTPNVTTAIQIVRSYGVGAESCGKLVSDIFECILGTRGKGQNIACNTVKASDAFSGASTSVRFLRKLAEHGGKRVQMAMDTSSGNRKQAGIKTSQVSLTARNPHSQEGRVLQVVVDSEVGAGGRAKDKLPQVRRVQQLARDEGFGTPKASVVDHENTAMATCELAGLGKTGCSTHKLKHMIESVDIPEAISSAITTLHTASCPASTNPTTSTGIKLSTSQIASNQGRLPKGFTLGRQVGNKYAWVARSCAAVLHNREKLIAAVHRKELYVPGSNAVDLLLNETTIPQLVVASLSYAAFKACLLKLKLDKEGEGELSVIEARKIYPECRGILQKLSRVQSRFPDWLVTLAPKDSLGLQAARGYFKKETAVLLRDAARAMLCRFDEFVSKDDELTPTRGSDLPHSNDFIEGAHGTLSMIQSRLPGINPERAVQLAQRRHNSHSLSSLRVPLVPSPNTYTELRKRKINSNEEVQAKVHKASMITQLRTEFTKLRMPELLKKCKEAGLPTLDSGNKDISKAVLVEMLIDVAYEPPDPTPDSARRKLF